MKRGMVTMPHLYCKKRVRDAAIEELQIIADLSSQFGNNVFLINDCICAEISDGPHSS